jgi:hypothetical protein
LLHVVSGLAAFLVLRVLLGQLPSMLGRNPPSGSLQDARAALELGQPVYQPSQSLRWGPTRSLRSSVSSRRHLNALWRHIP